MISITDNYRLFLILFSIGTLAFAVLAGWLKDESAVGMYLAIGAAIGSGAWLLYTMGISIVANHLQTVITESLGRAENHIVSEITESALAGMVCTFLHPIGPKTRDEQDEAVSEAVRTWCFVQAELERIRGQAPEQTAER